MLLDILSEERNIREIQFVGDLFYALLCFTKLINDVFHHILINQVWCWLTGNIFTYSRQIFWWYMQAICIIRYWTFLRIAGCKKVDECLKQVFCWLIGRRFQGNKAVQRIMELIQESQQQSIYQFAIYIKTKKFFLSYFIY